MRRVLTTSALVVGGLLAAACSDQRSPLPTEPPFSPSLTAGRSCPSPLQLAALTVALFAPGDLLTFARNTQASISLKMSRGDLAGARKLALAFIDFTLKTYYQGNLRDPNGPNRPTTAEAVVTLIDGILCWVGLPPSGLDLTKSADVTVTTKVIGKDGGQFKSTDELSGLKVPPGAVSEDRLFVITRRDDLATAGTCVSSKLKSQIPLCIDFAVVPAQDVAKPLVVAICQPEDAHPPERRLAHKLSDGRVELLAVVADPFPLVCTSTPDFPPPGSGGLTRAVWGVGSFLARVLGPERLHAAHTGLGGLLGPKASPVTAVLVRLSFVVQPSNTGAGDPISPAVQVAYQDPESEAVDTEIVNPIHLTLGANPGPASLADTLENPSSGIATFADVRIGVAGSGYTLVADAFSSVFTGDSLLHIPATSSEFNVGSPDLVISSAAPTVTPNLVVAGGTVGLAAWTIKNQGSGAVSNGTVVNVAYFLSQDATITRTDIFLGSTFVTSAGMTPGQENSGPALVFTVPAATTPGNYWIGILADQDNAVTESNEANNFVSTPLTITAAATNTINFEAYPNGEPTCSRCSVTTDFLDRGVDFAYETFDQQFPGATLGDGNGIVFYGDPANLANHFVTSALTDAGQAIGGYLTMTFPAPYPHAVRFDWSVPSEGATVPIDVFPGGSETAVSQDQITRTVIGSSPWRRVEVRNNAGIQRVVFNMTGYVQEIDNVVLTP